MGKSKFLLTMQSLLLVLGYRDKTDCFFLFMFTPTATELVALMPL